MTEIEFVKALITFLTDLDKTYNLMLCKEDDGFHCTISFDGVLVSMIGSKADVSYTDGSTIKLGEHFKYEYKNKVFKMVSKDGISEVCFV